jgi:NAD(P)-dependent dehydrogenase (short-subunit alcohol dehydrogenase family)
MTNETFLARRTFTAADQLRFAAVSGDRNPMHVDAVLARRTPAGVPVAHGVHLLLWALDVLARSCYERPPIGRLTARFKQFVAVEETVTATLTKRTEAVAWLDLTASGLTAAQIVLEFCAPAETAETPTGEAVSAPAAPLELAFEEMEGLSGRLAFAGPPEYVAAMFPAASDWLGPRRVAGLAASTLLVGMVCPGLHSMYSSLTLRACEESTRENRLGFRVVGTDPRFRVVRSTIAGGGWIGTVESFARLPPMSQASLHEVARLVGRTEFTGSTALVVGGSRGLGEVTAKVLAAGGARVIVTYRVGKVEAEAIVHDICAAGGSCEALPYNARRPAEPQLARLDGAPTHAYYFATPVISKAQSMLFSRARLDAFFDVYVDGFVRLAQALQARRNDVSLFYPSSVYLSQRPRGMLEYAMAKAAGETLCSEMNQAWAPLRVTVNRLPRLPTDQTASVIKTDLPTPVSCLLPAIRETQSWPHRKQEDIPRQSDSNLERAEPSTHV